MRILDLVSLGQARLQLCYQGISTLTFLTHVQQCRTVGTFFSAFGFYFSAKLFARLGVDFGPETLVRWLNILYELRTKVSAPSVEKFF